MTTDNLALARQFIIVRTPALFGVAGEFHHVHDGETRAVSDAAVRRELEGFLRDRGQPHRLEGVYALVREGVLHG